MTAANLKAYTTGKVAESPVAKFSGFMDKLKPQLALALPKHMNADRMARLALTAFSTNKDLQECSPTSIAGSIMTAAQLGLEPGINGQGYLIPYKGTCTFVPGWKGLVDLVARSGRATVWTGVVYGGDQFEYQLGDSPFCRHVPGDGDEGDQFTHVYAIGRVRDATMPVIEVWTRGKVSKHLKTYNKVGNRHYANASENNFEMYARKIALLQVLKYMPASIELANAIDVSNATETGRGAVLEGNFVQVAEIDGADDIDHETGEVPPPPPPAAARAPAAATRAPAPPVFNVKAFIARIEACTDMATLQLMSDESEEIPEGPDRDAVNAALLKRDGELAPPPEDHQQEQQAQPEPATRRRGSSRVSAD